MPPRRGRFQVLFQDQVVTPEATVGRERHGQPAARPGAWPCLDLQQQVPTRVGVGTGLELQFGPGRAGHEGGRTAEDHAGQDGSPLHFQTVNFRVVLRFPVRYVAVASIRIASELVRPSAWATGRLSRIFRAAWPARR